VGAVARPELVRDVARELVDVDGRRAGADEARLAARPTAFACGMSGSRLRTTGR
jgi:hypothetical protein